MAEGKFPSVVEYMRGWTQTIVDALRKSAIDEMNENKAKSKFPSHGDPAASALVAGMRFESSFLGEKIEFNIIMPQGWNWLETGRSPGKMPPEEPIVKWLVHRGIKPDLLSKSRKRLIKSLKTKRLRKGLNQHSLDNKRKQLAYLIRRKIGKTGTRATHFYSNVVTDKLKEDLRQVLKEKYNKDIFIEFKEIETWQ